MFLATIVPSLLLFSPSGHAERSMPEPQCTPDPREEDVPEFLYSFDSFDKEAFEKDMNAMKEMLPSWIENEHARLLKSNANPENSKIFEGEISMAYINTLNGIEGYLLKLQYLAADEAERPQMEKAFCDFIKQNIIID